MPRKTIESDNFPFNESVIVKACVNDDRIAQSRLYEKFAGRMMQVCLRYARDRQEAEEIMMEGFCRVFKYIHQFRFKGSLEGWIRKVMVNAALQKYYPLRICTIESATPLDKPCTEPDSYALLDYQYMMALVQQLPAAYRLVFNLHVFEGFKHREIAEMLGISEGTSKSNLADARLSLQKSLLHVSTG